MNSNRILILLCSILFFFSCVKETIEPIHKEGQVSFKLKIKEVKEIQTRSNIHEDDLNELYLIVFDGTTDLFVECKPASLISNNNYKAALTPRAAKVRVVAVANVAPIVKAKMSGWVTGTTTFETVSSDLLTSELSTNNGMIVSMPELPPMSAEMILDKIERSMNIVTPFEMVRATAKITISTAENDFTVIGSNLYNTPVKGYILPNQSSTNLLSIVRADYAGTDGHGAYGSAYMISTATPSDPLYSYETTLHTDITQHPYLIINSNRGYYRINLTDKADAPLSLQRNYHYKINITKVSREGASTPEEAENNPPLVSDVIINDPDSYEIISNGVDYLGLSNSEYILYVSSIINEFNYDAMNIFYGLDYDKFNGFFVSTLAYKSHTSGTVTCSECVTESGTGILRFRDAALGVWDETTINPNPSWSQIVDELALPSSINGATSKKIIVVIPHDFISGKLKVKVGPLEREIDITRNQNVPFTGDAIKMGSGFSTATIDFEKSFIPASISPSSDVYPVLRNFTYNDLVGFSNSEIGPTVKTWFSTNPTDDLWVKVNPVGGNQNNIFTQYSMYPITCSEFYLTRKVDQSRVKVHLIREPFNDGIKDTHGCGSPFENYSAAFWTTNQKGERIIRVPKVAVPYYWSARVIYGHDFIRLAHTDDSRTLETGEDGTIGNAEDYAADNSWKTYLETRYTNSNTPENILQRGFAIYPKFRIALTEINPNPSKPRYGLVVFSVPYSKGSLGTGQTFLIFVRQGEEPDYVFSPTEQYGNAPRSFAQAFSPYNLTVSDPANHPGGPNYADHKSMNGRGVFTEYPSQIGYQYRWGDDVAIHPKNPKSQYTPINGYTYNYDHPYQEICPNGYTLAKTDENNSTFLHSFAHPTIAYNRIGLCADGYKDRLASSNVGNGGESTNSGYVYYNRETLASMFIVIPPSRYENNNLNSITWGRIDNWTDDPESQGVVGSNPPSIAKRDRVMPVRCVKTP